ncbi:hypothetical protein D3C76_1495650 [compost metagenome]
MIGILLHFTYHFGEVTAGFVCSATCERIDQLFFAVSRVGVKIVLKLANALSIDQAAMTIKQSMFGSFSGLTVQPV